MPTQIQQLGFFWFCAMAIRVKYLAMIYRCLSQFSLQTIVCVMLVTEISSLQRYRDSRLASSASPDVGNYFPMRCNSLHARAQKQVWKTGNQQDGKEVEISIQEAALDVNQTLTPIVAFTKENTVCYDDLGCITRFSFADPLLWPINLLPEKREKINTHFTLHTRENPNPQPPIRISADNPNQISATTFKAKRRTKFIAHGWRETGYEDIYKLLLQRLLMKDDCNVVCVHWGGGSSAFYFQAHANIRLVGLEIARLVNITTEKLGVNATDVHLIGFSLGAHAVGYAGEHISNLGRITGLDPAGPYFESMPSYARLDYTDAQFVDAVHTNAGFLGIYEPVGHLDFYPNGGIGQPGCTSYSRSDLQDQDTSLTNFNGSYSVSVLIASAHCDHMRAVQLYSASLQDSCHSVGYKCSDYDSFNSGKCTSCGSDNTKCAPFGLEAKTYPSRSRINVKLYFNTDAYSPYCISQYLVLVNFGKPPNAKATVTGLLRLTVTGEDALQTTSLPISFFEHGKDYKFLMSAPSRLGPIRKVHLQWRYIHLGFADPTCFLGFCNKRLYVNHITVSLLNSYPQTNKISDTYVTCPRYTPAAIATLQTMEFSVENSCSSTFHLPYLIWNTVPWVPLPQGSFHILD